MNKRMRGRTRAADHRKTHLGAMLLFMFTLAALIAAALIRPAMRTDKPDGDELTNIEIVLDHVDADEGVSRRVLLELMKADTDKSTGIGLSTEGPTVLIYHTHTTEAYFPTKRYTYAASYESATRWYLKMALGARVNLAEDDAALIQSAQPEISSLTLFPDAQCCRIIDGVLYIRLG